MESLGYCLLNIYTNLQGRLLPWANIKSELLGIAGLNEDNIKIMEAKIEYLRIISEDPYEQHLKSYILRVRKIEFEETPPYEELKELLSSFEE